MELQFGSKHIMMLLLQLVNTTFSTSLTEQLRTKSIICTTQHQWSLSEDASPQMIVPLGLNITRQIEHMKEFLLQASFKLDANVRSLLMLMMKWSHMQQHRNSKFDQLTRILFVLDSQLSVFMLEPISYMIWLLIVLILMVMILR